MYAYCIFCRTGQENTIAEFINRKCGEVYAIAPVRVLEEKRGGQWELKEQSLIPGYIFVYSDCPISHKSINTHPGVYKVLQYPNGAYELSGSDYEYARWIYRNEGRIAPSKVVTIGSLVKVVDGPLMDGIGTIIKLDRHKRRAVVEFNFYGNKQKVSLCVKDITSLQH